MADVQFPVERETEEVVILESAWYPDYSKPPKSDRRWLKEGEEVKFTMSVARHLRQQGLVVDKGIKFDLPPSDLKGRISNAAWNYLKKTNYEYDKIKEFLHGTGPLGAILLRDVTAYLQEFMMPGYQAST